MFVRLFIICSAHLTLSKGKKTKKKIPNKLAIPNDSFGLYLLLRLGKTVVVFCALGFGFHQSDDYDDDDD